MSDNGEAPRPRANVATVLAYQHEEAMARAAKTAEPSASVEITRNAKGEVQFTTKVYALASSSEEDVRRATEAAYDQAVEAFDHLGALYPVGQSQGAQEYAREARAAAKKAS